MKLPRLLTWLLPVLLMIVVAVGLLASPDALARVGGGQSFGGGGGSSGGGGSGSGGSGDLIWFLIWLILEHPIIGIPVTIVVVLVGIAHRFNSRRSESTWRTHQSAAATQSVRSATSLNGSQRLKEDDPNFSEPLLLDFAQLVYARAQQLRPGGVAATLAPLMAAKAAASFTQHAGQIDSIDDVIFGATRLVDVRLSRQWTQLVVAYSTNLTEVRQGKARQLVSEERWTFRRACGVRSPGPDRMRSLGCVSCGSTVDAKMDGHCPNCESPRRGGLLQWEVVAVRIHSRRPLSRPELHLGGGVEPGTRAPTLRHPDLPARRRAFQARYPDFDWKGFKARVDTIFSDLQRAWSTQEWELARPHETDALFQVHRFWMARYRRFGLVNRIEDVTVLKLELANLDTDAWLESVTVRVWARMRDWTEETDGQKVVGGSKTQPRTFSEYWTFIRTVGAGDHGTGPKDALHCPSCGAPLDRIGMSGVCGYCDAKITGGDYDWVLSRIEQDETYGR